MGRQKQKENSEIETQKETYNLNPPCQFEIRIKEFESQKMDGYVWTETGRFWRDGEEILLLDVDEVKL